MCRQHRTCPVLFMSIAGRRRPTVTWTGRGPSAPFSLKTGRLKRIFKIVNAEIVRQSSERSRLNVDIVIRIQMSSQQDYYNGSPKETLKNQGSIANKGAMSINIQQQGSDRRHGWPINSQHAEIEQHFVWV